MKRTATTASCSIVFLAVAAVGCVEGDLDTEGAYRDDLPTVEDGNELEVLSPETASLTSIVFTSTLPNSVFRSVTVPAGGGDVAIFLRDCCIRDDVVEVYIGDCKIATVDSRSGPFGTHPGETHTVSLAAGTHTVEYRNTVSGTGPSGWEVEETVNAFTGNFPLPCGDEFEINFASFIPHDNVIGPPQSRCNRRMSFGSQLYFAGDNRSFSSSTSASARTRSLVTVIPDASVDADGLKAGTIQNLIGQTRSYADDALPVIDAADDDGVLGDCSLLHGVGTASNSGMNVTVTRTSPDEVEVHIYGGASNPLVTAAPAIDWDFTITIDKDGNYSATGAHDGFPAYEIYINGTAIHTYSPGAPPYTFIGHTKKLFPPLDATVSGSGTLP